MKWEEVEEFATTAAAMPWPASQEALADEQAIRFGLEDELAKERAEIARLTGAVDTYRRDAMRADAALADAHLMLRAIGSTYWEQEAHSGDVWRWRRLGPYTAQAQYWNVPRTGPAPEINDAVREAMQADVRGE